jgi:hypothetical protein
MPQSLLPAKGMEPAEAPGLFRERVKSAALTVEKLTPAEALAQMLSFYREVRARKCMVDLEGDALLFQWGTHQTEEGKVFELDFTRQFIQPGNEDDDGMSQFWVILHYDVTDKLLALGSGELECESPDGVDAFQEQVLASEAYRAVVELTPAKVEVDWAMV